MNQIPIELTPIEFVSLLNQTLDFAYSSVVIVGELSSFRIARGKWVYFDLKDDEAKVSFFGSVYTLPGPLEDGLIVRVKATPRLHPQFGFSLNFSQITVAGEGSLKRAADLLALKLEKEGLFDQSRKQPLPPYPETIVLVSAKGSAAESDFHKITRARWPMLEIISIDALVQGAEAADSIVQAIAQANQISQAEVLVITRGGGSTEDLAAFNDEKVVRAIAGSRLPSIVAIGHEKDFSLAEQVADARASTPTNAAMLVTADAVHEQEILATCIADITRQVNSIVQISESTLNDSCNRLKTHLDNLISKELSNLNLKSHLVASLDPIKPLRQGYAVLIKSGKRIYSVNDVQLGNRLDLRLSDGTISTIVEGFK